MTALWVRFWNWLTVAQAAAPPQVPKVCEFCDRDADCHVSISINGARTTSRTCLEHMNLPVRGGIS